MTDETLSDLLRSFADQTPALYRNEDPHDQERVFRLADALRAKVADAVALGRLEEIAAERAGDLPLAVQLAVKLARSKQIARVLGPAFQVSVVFSMFKEHQRMLRPEEHPHGEDFLRVKMRQLEWLLRESGGTWRLIAVDDGCPEASGQRAREILDGEPRGARATVLFLEDAIREKLPIATSMSSTTDSRKGGSIHYGMWHATRSEPRSSLVVFTDADLSTHLGLVGLLADPILNGTQDVAIGSRRAPTSVVIKRGARNLRGKLFIFLWKRMIPVLDEIIDTQCGFKAFRTSVIPELTTDSIEQQFAFDIELLIRAQLRNPGSIARVPIAWIDSEAASTTTDIQPYLPMLQATARMYRRYLPPNPRSTAFADFVEALDEPRWARLVDQVPPAIAEADPSDLGALDSVSVEDMERGEP